MNFKFLNNLKAIPVGHCIYCFSDKNLTDEHIVPYALSGSYILPTSSCVECNKITCFFEGKVLNYDYEMRKVRALKGLKSRRKLNVPMFGSFIIVEDGNEKKVEFPIREGPHFLSFPIFPPPVNLKSIDGYHAGIIINGLVTYLFNQEKFGKICKENGIKDFAIEQMIFPNEFARMIAKIAYSFAYAEGRINFRNQKFLDSLLGKTDDIGRWVGVFPHEYTTHPGILHWLTIKDNFELGILLVEVQLFSESGTPTYTVVLKTQEN